MNQLLRPLYSDQRTPSEAAAFQAVARAGKIERFIPAYPPSRPREFHPEPLTEPRPVHKFPLDAIKLPLIASWRVTEDSP
jgi:hypothetical protein